MDLKTAQNDMATAYVNGAPGVAVSGLVWIVAGLVWMRAGIQTGFTALFIGGMLIVPLSLVAARLLFRAPKPVKGNPVERLALESTFTLFAGILIAYGLLRVAPTAIFPIMAIIIGARYFVFRTIYDEPMYWALGALLAVAGAVAGAGPTWPSGSLAIVVGTIELVFSVALFARRPGS